jgi:lycopene beta-cyclase
MNWTMLEFDPAGTATDPVPWRRDAGYGTPAGLPSDLIIVGAGPSGWITALEAARRRPDCRVHLFEKRPEPLADRVWCWWSCAQAPWPSYDHEWPAWQVLAGDRSVNARVDGVTYRMLRASTFVAQAQAEAAQRPNLTVEHGQTVRSIAETGERVHVELTDGRRFVTPVVLDTRPPAHRPGAWRQAFHGWEVQCRNGIFDPGSVILMGFHTLPDQPIRFFYVLPLSPHHALVEETAFTPDDVGPPGQAGLEGWLAGHDHGGYQVLREESGVLPMDPTLTPPRQPARILPLGARGGAGRPATGYAFVGLATQARRFAARWATAPHAPQVTPSVRSPAVVWMDRVFLRALKRIPDAHRRVFAPMFGAAPAASVRFLSDTGGVWAAIRVIAVMPKIPFIRAALESRAHD